MTQLKEAGLKVLIVDNNAQWRKYMRTLFNSGTTVVECTSGSSAVITYGKERPDWVIMDIAMDEIDGLSAARKIKQAHPKARVIFLTQFSEPEFRDEAAALGAEGYVLKDDVDQVQELIGQKAVAKR